jgi:hypothetical protein
MSYPQRQQIDVAEENAPRLRIVVKQNGASNASAKKAAGAGGRLQRLELAALGWEPRRRRLNVK